MGKTIFDHYLGRSLKIGQHVNSPFRHDSNSGSFNLYINEKSYHVYFKDHVTDTFGDAVDFVRILFKLSSYIEARDLIKAEVGSATNLDDFPRVELPRQRTFAIQNAIITYKKRHWTNADNLFWNPYLVQVELLEKYGVFPVHTVTIQKGERTYQMHEIPSDPIYIIEFPSGRCKVYRPLTFNKANKWRSNIRIEDVFGLELLADDLPAVFIMAGNKDTVCMASLLGFDLCVAMPSESVTISPYIYEVLKSKAKAIYVVYDADKTGIEKTRKLQLEYPDIIDASQPILSTNKIDANVKDFAGVVKKYHTNPTAVSRLRQFYFDLINKNID